MATAAGLSLAACSLITSISGLEATGTDASQEGGPDERVETRTEGAATEDENIDTNADGGRTNDSAFVDGAFVDGAFVDSTLVDSAFVDSAFVDGAFVDSALVDRALVDSPLEVDVAPTDSGGGACGNVLADPDNCGVCGHSCFGGACAAGTCGPVTLATTHGSIGIAVDSTFVYWADTEAGVINKVSKSLTRQGAPSPVATGAAAQNVQGIASDGTYVYWTNKTAAGDVRRALPTGLGLTVIASNQSQPDWVASNGSTVAWTNQTGNQVMSASVVGGAPTRLNTTGELGTLPAGIAIDSASVYYATKTAGGGLAETVPLAGGPVSELGTATYVGIGIDSDNVYWTGGFSNPIVSQNTKAGTTATVKIIATGGALRCPLAVASDGANVYFLDQGTDPSGTPVAAAGALYRVPVGNGGTLSPPLVAGLTDPQGIALDGAAVYWVTGGANGAVMRLVK